MPYNLVHLLWMQLFRYRYSLISKSYRKEGESWKRTINQITRFYNYLRALDFQAPGLLHLKCLNFTRGWCHGRPDTFFWWFYYSYYIDLQEPCL